MCSSCPWVMPSNLDKNSVAIMKDQGEDANKKLTEMFNFVSPAHKIDICQLGELAVPKINPLIYNTIPAGSRLSAFYLNSQDDAKIISDYLEEKVEFVTPKRILINSGQYSIYLGTNITIIPKWKLDRRHLELEETLDNYVIKKKKKNMESTDTNQDINTEQNLRLENNETCSALNDQVQRVPGEVIFHDSVEMQGLESNESIIHHNNPSLPISQENENILLSSCTDTINEDNQNLETNQILDSDTIQDLFPDFPKMRQRSTKMFLHPEHHSNEEIVNLLHMNKQQFIVLCDNLRPHMGLVKSGRGLSVHAITFLFRYKLVTNLSFGKLASHFCIEEKTARQIFNEVMSIYYKHLCCIPNFLDKPDVKEKMFEDAYQVSSMHICKH